MIKRGSKKADTNMLWIVIGLILILIVVAVILFFFGKGTFNLADVFNNLFRKENIDTVNSACQIACSTSSTNDWCTATRQLTFKTTIETTEGTSKIPIGTLKSVTITCDSWSKGESKTTPVEQLGTTRGLSPATISSCGSITCA